MSPWRGAANTVAALCVAALLGPAPAARAAQEPADDLLVLPKPVGEIPLIAPEVVTPERRRTTFVPGPVRDDERIAVSLGVDGTPTAVTVTQRLTLSGTGDFAIRQRGPALRVTALDGTTAPIIQRGTVVWQGFVPGRRELAARIALDPAREALLLPLRVDLTWESTAGALGAGGVLPGPGRLTLRLINQTARPDTLPTGTAAAADLAPLLERLRRHAVAETGAAPPPAAGRGLPLALPARDVGSRAAVVAAPLRIHGTVRIQGGAGVTVSGPGSVPTPDGDGAVLDGVLHGEAAVTLDVPAGDRAELDLSVVPTLDPRLLQPPAGAPTWTAWAAGEPAAAARRTATDTLVTAAAAAARADEVAPYLGHPGPGPTSTAFTYRLAPAPRVAEVVRRLRPRPMPIAVTALGLAALSASLVTVWRRL